MSAGPWGWTPLEEVTSGHFLHLLFLFMFFTVSSLIQSSSSVFFPDYPFSTLCGATVYFSLWCCLVSFPFLASDCLPAALFSFSCPLVFFYLLPSISVSPHLSSMGAPVSPSTPGAPHLGCMWCQGRPPVFPCWDWLLCIECLNIEERRRKYLNDKNTKITWCCFPKRMNEYKLQYFNFNYYTLLNTTSGQNTTPKSNIEFYETFCFFLHFWQPHVMWCGLFPLFFSVWWLLFVFRHDELSLSLSLSYSLEQEAWGVWHMSASSDQQTRKWFLVTCDLTF